MKQKFLILLVAIIGSMSALAADVLTAKQDPATSLYGYVNQDGKWKIKPAYQGATDFFTPGESSKQQYAWVKEADGMYSLINGKGKIALQGKYHNVSEPKFLGYNTKIIEVHKSETGPKQIVLIHEKQVSELPAQFTIMRFVSNTEPTKEDVLSPYNGMVLRQVDVYPKIYSCYLENGENASLLTINAYTGETSTKQLDYKILSDPYHGYYVVVKNGEYQVFNSAKGTYHPMDKLKNIWYTRENLVEDLDAKYRYQLTIDKDFNIVGALNVYSSGDQTIFNGKLVFASVIYKSDSKNGSLIIDIEKGKVIGDYNDISISGPGYIVVSNKRVLNPKYDEYIHEYGCLTPDGEPILPVEYYKMVFILDNSGVPTHIAAQKNKDGSVEIFDIKGNKITTLPDGLGSLQEDSDKQLGMHYSNKFVKLQAFTTGLNYDIQWFDVNGKKLTPDNCVDISPYRQNDKQTGWLVSGKNRKMIYDMDMKPIEEIVPVKEVDPIAELYKKRDFVGRPIGAVKMMYDQGLVKKVNTVWQSAINGSAIYDITLKDGSVYRIETNSWSRITKAKKYR